MLVVSFTAICLIAGWWQLHQALRGNGLSWAYTVEWPIFAVIAIVAWWHLIHEDPAERAARTVKADEPVAGWDDTVAVDPERVAAAARAEYAAHLARLTAADESLDHPPT